MSDFLFRMVERAAGLGAGTTALPRPTVTAEANFLQPGRAGEGPSQLPMQPVHVRGTQQDAEHDQVNSHRVGRSLPFRTQSRVDNTPRPFAPKITTDNVLGTTREDTPSTLEQPLAAEATRETQEFGNGFLNAPGKTSTTGTIASVTETRMPVRDVRCDRTAEDTPPLTSQPSTSFVSTRTVNPIVPLNEVSQSSRKGPQLQEVKNVVAAGTSTEISGPIVEVKIGRVEIKFDAPATPPPAAPPQPRGFSEYAALRTYGVRPRFSGSR
jgi:hypothetical protein